MTRIDIDLLRYGSRGAVYRVNYDSRMRDRQERQRAEWDDPSVKLAHRSTS
jgi:hypothetical protein